MLLWKKSTSVFKDIHAQVNVTCRHSNSEQRQYCKSHINVHVYSNVTTTVKYSFAFLGDFNCNSVFNAHVQLSQLYLIMSVQCNNFQILCSILMYNVPFENTFRMQFSNFVFNVQNTFRMQHSNFMFNVQNTFNM